MEIFFHHSYREIILANSLRESARRGEEDLFTRNDLNRSNVYGYIFAP